MTDDEREFDLVSEIVTKLRMGGPNAAEITGEAADTINRLRTALTASEAENAVLAAGACICVRGDEHGNAYCEMQQRLAASEAKVQKAREALKPFALISIEGVAKSDGRYVSITTQADYFHRAATTLKDIA